MGEQCKRLQGLAQPHVVRQDAAQAVVPEERQPVETFMLVGAQIGLQAGRQGNRVHGLQVQQGGDGFPPRHRFLGFLRQFFQLRPEPGLVAADGQFAGVPFLQPLGLVDQGVQVFEFRPVQGKIGAVHQQQLGLALGDGLEDVREGDQPPFHRDHHGEVKPVAAFGLHGGDFQLGRFQQFPVVRPFAGDLHPEPVRFLHLGQHMFRELGGLNAAQGAVPGDGVEGFSRGGQQGSFGGDIAVGRVDVVTGRGLAGQRQPGHRAAVPVFPFPAQGQRVLCSERSGEHQHRRSNFREPDRLVAAGDGQHLAQPRIELFQEHRSIRLGHGDGGALQQQALVLLGQGFGRGRQRDGVRRRPDVDAVAADDPGSLQRDR